jgi:hypothetical protein
MEKLLVHFRSIAVGARKLEVEYSEGVVLVLSSGALYLRHGAVLG